MLICITERFLLISLTERIFLVACIINDARGRNVYTTGWCTCPIALLFPHLPYSVLVCACYMLVGDLSSHLFVLLNHDPHLIMCYRLALMWEQFYSEHVRTIALRFSNSQNNIYKITFCLCYVFYSLYFIQLNPCVLNLNCSPLSETRWGYMYSFARKKSAIYLIEVLFIFLFASIGFLCDLVDIYIYIYVYVIVLCICDTFSLLCAYYKSIHYKFLQTTWIDGNERTLCVLFTFLSTSVLASPN